MAKLNEGVYEKYGVSYKTLTLTDGDFALTVTPEKGGMATSFTKAGDEYLWLRDKNFESTDRPRCGVPILFPNCGKPDDGVHHFNGADYPIENHGLADLLPWQVKSATDEAIELTLTPNGLTKFVYPFEFCLTMRYTLAGGKAGLALTVENKGDKAMPFSVGFHPYFAASKLENVNFDIKAATCSESAKGEQPAAPAQITLTKKDGAAESIRLLTGVKSPMVLTDSGSDHKVTVAFDEAVFGNGVLWQQNAETFVCMEPWNGWANSVNEDGKHETLAPGSSKVFAWSITIE
ncbi:MAG: aldose epimerase [Subdoligranulum variabile]|uniref:aldose epimerase family protein n=1 Tax=Gemmiger sp. TaxID=2049027 RepID=UPI002A916B5F|nr:aldose epimerase [Gemmiger sp.]MDD7639266.1 aldose epimerase [Subdoligranulum variabile]MDY5604494.1 aldose epimerase [Gemmiger sp.]